MGTAMRIDDLSISGDLNAIRGLFRRYADWLEEDHGILPETHGIEQEIARLPAPYSPPNGALIAARSNDGEYVGCIALRRFDDEASEVKRLFVLPEARGLGIGEALVGALIEKAKMLGYSKILLDVGDYQAPARALYAKCGFTETSAMDHIR